MNQENGIMKLKSAARAVVTYEVGLPRGCARIRNILHWLGDDYLKRYPVFDEYDLQIDDLPTGANRLLWDRDALKAIDVRIESISRDYRDRIFEACWQIIDCEEAPVELLA